MIDREHLSRQTAGDPTLQRELLMLFQGQLEDLCRRLEAWGANGGDDDPDLLPLVHRLRGGAAAVGAWDIAESLGAFEEARERGSIAPGLLASFHADVSGACQRLADVIAAMAPSSLAKGTESR